MEGVEKFETYAPVVSWNKVRLMLIFSINQGWDTIQVDLSNNIVQDKLVSDVYLAFPYYFDSDTGEYRSNMVMELNKSLYGMLQDPLHW